MHGLKDTAIFSFYKKERKKEGKKERKKERKKQKKKQRLHLCWPYVALTSTFSLLLH
jgi:hypothetical protein